MDENNNQPQAPDQLPAQEPQPVPIEQTPPQSAPPQVVDVTPPPVKEQPSQAPVPADKSLKSQTPKQVKGGPDSLNKVIIGTIVFLLILTALTVFAYIKSK